MNTRPSTAASRVAVSLAAMTIWAHPRDRRKVMARTRRAGPPILLVALALGCSSTAETRTTFIEQEADAGQLDTGGFAGTGGSSQQEAGGRDGLATDSAPPTRVGDPCYREHAPGTVCIRDVATQEHGCLVPSSGTTCWPFEDAG